MINPKGGSCAQKRKNIDEKEGCLFLHRICRKIGGNGVVQRICKVFWRWRSIFSSVLLSGAKDPVGRLPFVSLKHFFRSSPSQNSGNEGSKVFQSGDGTDGRNTTKLDPSLRSG